MKDNGGTSFFYYRYSLDFIQLSPRFVCLGLPWIIDREEVLAVAIANAVSNGFWQWIFLCNRAVESVAVRYGVITITYPSDFEGFVKW